jgi:hypothetical protein
VENEIKEKYDLQTLEKMFVDNKIDNLDSLLKEKQKEFELNMLQVENKMITIEYDKEGNKKEIINGRYKNPLVLNNYFLKSINPYKNVQPEYTAESLNAVFDLYCEILTEVNVKIGTLPPSISSFCKFAGISSYTFKSYKSSPEIEMRNVVDAIEDYCYDTSVSMSQSGFIKERTTVYRMKSEQEKMEKEQQKVVINAKSVNIGEVQEKIKRIQELKKFNNKNRLIEAEFEEKNEQ